MNLSETSGTASADDDVLWRMRWILLASLLVVLGALGLLVSMHQQHWRWPLFVFGVAVGLAGLVIIAALLWFVWRRPETTAEQRLRLRRRLIIYVFCWVAAGLICGTAAAAFNQAWIDIAAAVYVAATFGAGGLLVVRRRNSRP